MADGLPPPPQRADSGDFAWIAWYNQLYQLLSSTGSLAWSLVNKAGSSIADLADHAHNLLSGMQGGTTNEYYHLTQAQHTRVTSSKSYGVFHDTTTQTAAVINTAYPITFNSTDLSNGVSIGSPTSRVVCATTNVYNFQFSAQLRKTSAAASKLWIWARVNGTDVTESAGEVTLAGSSAALVASWNYVLSMTAGDYFELVWATDSTASEIIHLASSAPVPGIPSIILTVTDNIS